MVFKTEAETCFFAETMHHRNLDFACHDWQCPSIYCVEMKLMNYFRQMCVGVITPPCIDCVTGHNAFNVWLLKPLPILHR